MLWHIVKFRFRPDVDDGDRREAEALARGLADTVPVVRFLRLARSIDEPDVTGLVVGFADESAFAAYDAHPAHRPVAQRIDGLCADVVRVDMVTDDDVDAFAQL